MAWGEAVSLTRVLCQDPSSWVASALAGWDHPVSRDSLVLMDLFDLTHTVNSKRRPTPYPRPWRSTDKKVAKPTLSQEDVLAALRYAGHAL